MRATAPENPSNPVTLVIGATGKTGRRVAAKLRAKGVPTRAVSRSTEIPFDWSDDRTWDKALEGVRHAYVSFVPDLAVPGTPPIIAAFATKAEERGIQRLVLLSGRGEEYAQECEQIVLGINPDWTVIRAGWFCQNFSEGFFQPGLQHGLLSLPAGSVREPFVDIEDIADVAVAALTAEGHEGEIYEVTGPRLLTFEEAVAEIARATGREIAYRQIPTEAYVEAARAQGAPAEIAGLLTFLFDTVLDGRNASVADGVERALGHPPRDFSDYACRTAATGAWDPPESPLSSDSTTDRPELLVRRLIEEAFNAGKTSIIPELVHPDYVYRSPGEVIDGPDGLAALIGAYRGAFPDLHIHIDELIAAEDATVLSFTLTGTHLGDLLGNAPTGRSVRVHGMVRSRFQDALIRDEWEILDMLGLFEQLGIEGATA